MSLSQVNITKSALKPVNKLIVCPRTIELIIEYFNSGLVDKWIAGGKSGLVDKWIAGGKSGLVDEWIAGLMEKRKTKKMKTWISEAMENN